jgi:bla regulator protein BlaR1
MGIYLLKFTACLALFYFFYKICLENENMHTFKRVYLLSSLAAALIIPALVFTEYVEAPLITYVSNQEYPIPQATTEPISIPMALEKDVLDLAPILWAIYFIGLAFFGIKFLRNLVQIIRRIYGNPKQRWHQFLHVLLQESLPPHTFLNYIFLNKTKFEANEIPKEVLLHEQTHASQKHSYDIIFVELLQVIFWVNPFIYFLKKAIKLNHEFLADQAVIKKGISQTEYQNTLLSYLSHDRFEKQESISIANAINYSSIKKRFNIMKTKTSKKEILLRSLLVLPLFSLLLLGFSETKEVQKQLKSSTHIKKQINEVLPPIKIYINEKQEITIEEEIIEFEGISKKLSQIIKSGSTEPTSKQEVHIEAKGNLNITLLKLIKEQITKEGSTLTKVTADLIKATNKTLENYSGIAFITRDTLQIKQDDGTFVLGFTTKEDPVTSKTQNSTQTQQDGATAKQLAEYNKLAKHYNSKSRNKMKIYKKDVERLEYLFSKMSDEQKSAAELFPNCPEPPPAPEAPQPLHERQEAEIAIQKIIKEQDSYDYVHAGVMLDPKGMGFVLPQKTSVYIHNSKSSVNTSPSLIKYLASEDLKEAQFYFEGKKVSSKEGLKIIKNEKDIKVETIPHTNKQPEVRIYKAESKGPIPPHPPHAPKVLKGEFSDIPPPPSPVLLNGNASAIPPPPRPASPNTAKNQNKGWTVSTSANRNPISDNTSEADYGELPIPPPAPAIAVHADKKEYSKELKTSIYKYLKNNNKLEQAVALFKKNNKRSRQELWNIYNETMQLYVEYYNLAKKEGNFIQPIPVYKERKTEKTMLPPPPPKPFTPLDHVIAMAKKDAQFLFEGEKISSDKAIELMKINKDLHIDSRAGKGEQPVVKISASPIRN